MLNLPKAVKIKPSPMTTPINEFTSQPKFPIASSLYIKKNPIDKIMIPEIRALFIVILFSAINCNVKMI